MRIIWDGQFDQHSTFGVISTRLCEELISMGIDVRLRPWPESTSFTPTLEARKDLPQDGLTVRLCGASSIGDEDYSFVPDFVPYIVRKDFKSIYDDLHKAKHLIVPSQWQKAMLASLGIDSDVVPRGSDMKPIDRERKDTNPYTFLFIGYTKAYKGIDILAEAAKIAFSENANIKIIIKGNDLKSHPQRDAERLKQDFGHLADKLEVIHENWPHDKLLELYERADCMVSPHRTFGMFGTRVVLEARKSGLPVIHPRLGEPMLWGDQRFLTDYRIGEDGIIPDVEDFAHKMRICASNRVKSWPLKGWTWTHAALKFREILRKDQQLQNMEPNSSTIQDLGFKQN